VTAYGAVEVGDQAGQGRRRGDRVHRGPLLGSSRTTIRAMRGPRRRWWPRSLR